jgi:hypothetical protein
LSAAAACLVDVEYAFESGRFGFESFEDRAVTESAGTPSNFNLFAGISTGVPTSRSG